jgi:hypothetical protein
VEARLVKHLPRRSLALALLLSSGMVALAAGAPGDRRADYSLSDVSAYEQGCFAPCECPIMRVTGLGGGFTLEPNGRDGDFRLYQVADVELSLAQGSLEIAARGDGTYRWGGEPPMQELVLDLSIDGGDLTKFDSGLVPVTVPFPGISVSVSKNGFYCLDQVFSIRARPLRSESAPSDPRLPLGPVKGFTAGGTITTWGAIKERYPTAP